MGNSLDGKNVLITGGTGSLGTALVERIVAKCEPKRLIVFSRDELKQYDMQLRFHEHNCLRFFLGDVRDLARLKRAFEGVDIVLHAAALKQVPALEYNPVEAVQTNILGAKNVIDAALDCGVEKVMAVSTDKACQPLNLYGATKMVMEKLMIQANAYRGQNKVTRFSCVRYGNVAGSRGSVIPVWKQLASEGKALPLTHPEMTRYLITLPQAVQFILSSLDLMHGGEVFIPKIPSMRMVDLAKAVAPEGATEVTGIRAGEKLAETLISSDESYRTVDLGDRYAVLPAHVWWKQETYDSFSRVEEGWSYRSDSNSEWLSDDAARRMIEGL